LSSPASGIGPAAPVILFILRTGKGTLFVQQRFAISHRDLIVIRVDFGKGKEAMAISAIVHKGRLQRGLHPRHLGQVDIPSQLTLVYRFKIEFFDLVSVHHDHAGFFSVGGIDKHLRHVGPSRPARADLPGKTRGRKAGSGRLVWAMVAEHGKAAARVAPPWLGLVRSADIIAVPLRTAEAVRLKSLRYQRLASVTSALAGRSGLVVAARALGP